jgi:hypothetical protein
MYSIPALDQREALLGTPGEPHAKRSVVVQQAYVEARPEMAAQDRIVVALDPSDRLAGTGTIRSPALARQQTTNCCDRGQQQPPLLRHSHTSPLALSQPRSIFGTAA